MNRFQTDRLVDNLVWHKWNIEFHRTMRSLSALRTDSEYRSLAADLATRLAVARRILRRAHTLAVGQFDKTLDPGVGITLKQMLALLEQSNTFADHNTGTQTRQKTREPWQRMMIPASAEWQRRERLREKRWGRMEQIADEASDEARDNYEEAREHFRLLMQILTEQIERQTQVVQKITS